MKSILVPLNFSESTHNAFLHGLKIANHLNIPLYVLYCYQSPVLSFSHAGQPDLLENVYEEITLSKFDFYKKRVPALRQLAEDHQLRQDNITFLFEEGVLQDVLQKTVVREEARLVVMGTDPFRIAHNVPVPGLVVPEQRPSTASKNSAVAT